MRTDRGPEAMIGVSSLVIKRSELNEEFMNQDNELEERRRLTPSVDRASFY